MCKPGSMVEGEGCRCDPELTAHTTRLSPSQSTAHDQERRDWQPGTAKRAGYGVHLAPHCRHVINQSKTPRATSAARHVLPFFFHRHAGPTATVPIVAHPQPRRRDDDIAIGAEQPTTRKAKEAEKKKEKRNSTRERRRRKAAAFVPVGVSSR